MKNTSDEEFERIVKNSYSRSEVIRAIGLHDNGCCRNKVSNRIKELGIDVSHFVLGGKREPKYEIVEKTCPVCGDKFKVQFGAPREKTVCSKACSNTMFRSGENNPNWKDPDERSDNKEYRRICFKYYKPKCVICGWKISVDVHHIDGNHKNNNPRNLIPICANHHRMCTMSTHKEEMLTKLTHISNKTFN